MKRFFAFIRLGLVAWLLGFNSLNINAAEQLRLRSLRISHLDSPQGYVNASPTFSWITESKGKDGVQGAYQIQVFKGKSLIWDSGKVVSDNSIIAPYGGPAFESGTRYYWRVKIWDGKGKASAWSDKATFLTGLYDKKDWKAQWIESSEGLKDTSPLFRKEFTLRTKVAQAVLHITSRGLYEVSINGNRVSEDMFTPGWTSYDKRLQYQSYDVTSFVGKGLKTNAIGVILGRGWYKSALGWSKKVNQRPYKGDNLALLAQIDITYIDGSKETVTTDGTWLWKDSEVVFSEIYHGETIDAGLAVENWNTIYCDTSSWKKVSVKDYGTDILVPTESENVRIVRYLEPKEVITTPAGEKVIDFGQNLVGFEILDFKGAKGQKITIDHAEVLDENGNFYTHNLRSAKAQSNFICSGGNDHFQPRFTFYGFRYIRVHGIDGELDPSLFKAAVVHSNFDDNGSFACSEPLVNQLQSNIRWGMWGNFLDIPTDCPQRDERLGWSGDAQAFFRTATFNGRVQNFFTKWMKDVTLDMHEDGSVPNVIPDIPNLSGSGNTGWADVVTVIPWQHYMAYGDPQILVDQYQTMKTWVDYMEGKSHDYIWDSGRHFADWLFFSKPNDPHGDSAVTYAPLVQQCYFAYSATVVAKTAAILGYKDDEVYYTTLAAKVRKAFCDYYLTPKGMLVSSTQTAYTLALAFDMVPEEYRSTLASNLAANVRKYKHITTGFLGTPYICHMLTEWGYCDLAYDLLMYKKYPGWLYQVTMGATTMWERWNSMLPDRTIPNNGMNSFNHYSFGAIGDWLYRGAVGIRELSPGFKTFEVRPHIGGPFTWMEASENTPYGRISARWEIGGGLVTMNVTVPFNTAADIYVPSSEGYTLKTVGSGTYTFTAPWNN